MYLIGGRTLPYKVGIASRPYARLSGIQTGSVRKLSLHRIFAVKDMLVARFLERSVHEAIAEHRHGGEWFSLPLDAIAAKIKAVAAHHAIGICDVAIKQKRNVRVAPENQGVSHEVRTD